jgi:transposase
MSPTGRESETEEIVHHAGSVCPGCGGTHFAKLGEDMTEVLEKIRARLKVIRHIGQS